MQELQIRQEDEHQRLDKYLAKYMPCAPLGFFYKMLRKKNIVLNGKKAEGKELLKAGDVIGLYLSKETIAGFQRSAQMQEERTREYRLAFQKLTGITVLFENDRILVLNKPAGILSQKAEKNDLSLNEWAIGYLLQTGALSEKELQTFTPSVLNRLDRNTSGLILVGKSLQGSQIFSRIIREHAIGKYYRCVVHGKMQQPLMTLKGVLQKDRQKNKVFLSDKGEGDIIETRYRLLESFRVEGTWYSELEIQLITGKSHQIRAHLASISHPLVGDEKYGERTAARTWQRRLKLHGQLLHAYRLELPEDVAKTCGFSESLTWIAPLPEAFAEMQMLKEQRR